MKQEDRAFLADLAIRERPEAILAGLIEGIGAEGLRLVNLLRHLPPKLFTAEAYTHIDIYLSHLTERKQLFEFFLEMPAVWRGAASEEAVEVAQRERVAFREGNKAQRLLFPRDGVEFPYAA